MSECSKFATTERLRQTLEDGLAKAEQDELAAHLEFCSQCCRRLESLAADSRYWSEIRLLDEKGTAEGRLSETDESAEPRGFDRDEIPIELLEPASEPGHLGRLGPYDILRVVGRGGMGIVFQARDRALDRLVAVKLLTPGLASTAAARRRFAREARAAAAVVNEHVVSIHAVDTTFQGVPYLVMQYVAGKSVQDRIDQGEPPSIREILRIGMQAAQGLAAAHAQGLIHRDVKPANILLENGVERVKITDFGLARAVDDATMTQSGVIAGTPRYMAPEQARGDAIDHRADLFSLGSVLYALCTGRAPFVSISTVATLKKVCEDTPPSIKSLNSEIPPWLIKIISRLHAKDPVERYRSAAEVADLLERCLAHVQQPGTTPLPAELVERPARWPSTARKAVAAGVLLCGLAALAGRTALGEQVVDYVATVLRLKTADGYLIIETDDANVAIKVDGNNLVVTGGGVKEVRLPVGTHNIQAVKNGTTVKEELVTITHGGRKTLSVHRETANQNSADSSRKSAETAWKQAYDEWNRKNWDTWSSSAQRTEKSGSEDLSKTNGQAGMGAMLQMMGMMRGRSAAMGQQTNKSEGKDTTSHTKGPPADNPSIVWHGLGKGRRSRLESIQPLDAFNVGSSEVRTLAYSPKGKRLALGLMDGTLWLCELAKDGRIEEFSVARAHDKTIASVAFSPDGTRLLSGGWDHRVKIWGLWSGGTSANPLWTWEGTADGARPVAFSPSSQNVALGSADGIVTILNSDTGREIQRSNPLGRPVNGLQFSPDGVLLALALGESKGDRSGQVQLWPWQNRSRLATTILNGWRRACNAVAFSRDGRMLAATCDDGTTRIYDMSTSRQTAALETAVSNSCLAFRPDGLIVGTGNAAGDLILWDTVTGNRSATVHDAHARGIHAVEFSPDGMVLATAGVDGTVKLWTMTETAPAKTEERR